MKLDDAITKYLNKYPKPTNLICPITGSPLIKDGKKGHVMDGDTFYHAESDKSIIYARHPFMWNMFRLVSGRNDCEQGNRFFKLLDNKSWQEYIADKRTDHLFPINTPQSEIEEYIQNEEKERQERTRLYNEGVANGTITPLPILTKIGSHLLAMETVSVQPLSPPTGKIYYTNFK